MARRAKKRTGGPSYEEVWADIEERESKKPLTKKQQEQERRKKLRLESLEQDKKIGAKESKGLLKADDSSIKKIHGTISKLTGHVRKAVIRIGSLEKRSDKIEGRADKIEEKTSKIVNILKSQKSKIGEKIPGSSRDSLNKTLIETNKILVDIQKQLTLQSKNEEKQQKEKSRKDSISESRRRLKAEESLLEKTSKGIGKVIGKVASKSLEPIKNIFDKIISFIALIGAGIATNATLEWLKDDKNREKINEWFGWIKDHWKWFLAGLGAIALIPVITTIAGLIGPIGTIVSLLLSAIPYIVAVITNPLFLGIAAAVTAGVGLYKAGREGIVGGPGFAEAHGFLDKMLEVSGVSNKGKNKQDPSKPLTQDQQSLYDDIVLKRKKLYELKKEQDTKANEEGNKIDRGRPLGKGMYSNDLAYEKARGVVLKKYNNMARELVGLPKRETGGPVMAGKPYIVGEGGPEIFSPNINGSIVNNMRTEKIYQMISSDMNQGGGINMIELPPITNQMPPPEIPVPTQQATDVPEISSTNMADPYRQLSPLLYGITV